MKEAFALTNQERDSALWKKLEAHLQGRLETLRKQNDQDLSPDETARQRGRIAAVKELIGYGQENIVNRKADE